MRRDVRETKAPTVLRCAVYTRKSSDEGLEQAFNSLHAQRNACEAYIRSQASEGWSCSAAEYDDGGFSGGSMERPALKRLLAEIEAGCVDVVVVYEVDRLTRNLGDFARIIEAFDKAQVSFVSVTQAFNTNSSMGRLTLNVLLSFAQFEREVTGERIRDKIALSKAKGMWMGGRLPMGYSARDHVLIPVAEEAEFVRAIFARYLKLGSVHRLCEALEAEGVRSKSQVSASGRSSGGMPYSRGALFHLLQNRTYLGEIVHRDQTYQGLHTGIVEPHLFAQVQKSLANNCVTRRRRADKAAHALLTGRLFDGEGRPFSPTFSTGRSGRVHRYYVAADLQQGRTARSSPNSIRRVGADALERLVLHELRRLCTRPLGPSDLPALLRRCELRPTDTQLVLEQEALFGLDHPDLALEELRDRLAPGERVTIEPGTLALRVTLPRRMQLRNGRTWILVDSGAELPPRTDPALVKALRKGHHLLRKADSSAPAQLYERVLLNLALLAPDLQRLILEGRQPFGFTMAAIRRAPPPPLHWREQHAWLQTIASSIFK